MHSFPLCRILLLFLFILFLQLEAYFYVRSKKEKILCTQTSSYDRFSGYLTSVIQLVLPEFLRSSGSGMGSTQPCEDN
jgi:hypothetical protein